MIALPTGTRIWIAAGVTDMRKGFPGLSAVVQTVVEENRFDNVKRTHPDRVNGTHPPG